MWSTHLLPILRGGTQILLIFGGEQPYFADRQVSTPHDDDDNDAVMMMMMNDAGVDDADDDNINDDDDGDNSVLDNISFVFYKLT